MVLDASGAIELLLNTAAGKRLADDTEAVHAPHLIDMEIAQSARSRSRSSPRSPRPKSK